MVKLKGDETEPLPAVCSDESCRYDDDQVRAELSMPKSAIWKMSICRFAVQKAAEMRTEDTEIFWLSVILQRLNSFVRTACYLAKQNGSLNGMRV